MLVAVKVAMYPSSHSCPIDMGTPDCRWGNMCAVLDACVNRGFRLSSSIWVDFMITPSVSMTWKQYVIRFLLLHSLFNVMYF